MHHWLVSTLFLPISVLVDMSSFPMASSANRLLLFALLVYWSTTDHFSLKHDPFYNMATDNFRYNVFSHVAVTGFHRGKTFASPLNVAFIPFIFVWKYSLLTWLWIQKLWINKQKFCIIFNEVWVGKTPGVIFFPY